MDISNLKYDPARINSALVKMPDKSMVTRKSIKIVFPKRFEEINFATIADEVICVGMVGVIVDDEYYAPLGVLMRFIFNAGEIEETVIQGERYVVLTFEPSETVIRRLVAATESMLGYYYYMEFCKFCNIPWYFNYKQILNVLDEAKHYTGKATSDTNQALRVIYSLTCRDPNDQDIPFRYSKSLENPAVEPEIIGVNNPGQLLTDVFSRFSGGYMSENTTAALLDDTIREATDVEKILKGIPNE